MADRELIAAILTAAMLPTVEVPQSRTQGRRGPITRAEGAAIQRSVDHAFGLYRLVLNELAIDPVTTQASPDPQTQAPAVVARDGVTSQFGHDAPHKKEPVYRVVG